MTDFLHQLEELARATNKPETEVITLAVAAGVRQLRRELELGRYLRGQITREEAVEAVGVDWVEMAERQRNVMYEDLEWAFGN